MRLLVIIFPLKDIYQHFFNFEDIPRRHEKLSMHWNSAGCVLGLISRICYCHRLFRQFNEVFYDEKKIEYLTQLNHYHFMRRYNAELLNAQSESSLDRFLDRLIGRYITLGCYLVLDLRIEWIHQLLRTGRFQFGHKDNDASLAYLSRSFFIRGLLKEEPRNPRDHEQRQQKQRIFNDLSKFEQESLRTFIKNASDEVNYLEWIENIDHKNWLVNQVLPSLWIPE